MLTHEKDRPHLAALSGLAATAVFLLLLFGPCFSAHAESFDFYATTNVTAGDASATTRGGPGRGNWNWSRLAKGTGMVRRGANPHGPLFIHRTEDTRCQL